MNRSIKVIVTASLLALSGNAAAIIMNNQIYGSSSYSLNDIDAGIQAFQDDVSDKRDRKRLKKARKLDRKVERLIYKMDSIMASGDDGKLLKKNRKTSRKEAKLLAILADYLPNLDELLQNGNMLTTSPTLLTGDTPPPDTFLTQLELVTVPETSTPGDNTLSGTVTASGTSSSENAAVPEPSMFALLGLGISGLMFAGRRRRL